MMATEAAVDKLADAPASEFHPAPDAHHVDLDQPTVNGTATPSDDIENKHISNVEDQANSAEVSVSGGSDTEASRTDGFRSKDGEKGHGRTGSTVKKPATFKAVSVNKTFLAAKANASSAVTKAADKPPSGPGTPPTSSASLLGRPRLVAKSGSGAGGSFTRSSSANGGKPPSAPDASAVWNKNRPAPPPEPKKFTDEELKKYGIHMASRLEEDDDKGQNKWADIDDDDDDWAPEAITWGDGTKTTLPHPDEHPAPPSDAGSVASRTKIVLDKPRSPAPPLVSSSISKSSGLASGKGLVLKSGGQEKPTLVAKPPAPPTPVKSPWAPLPPVEKASPVPTDAHIVRGNIHQPSQQRAAHPPPREIAPDDFSRSTWREGASHGNRELYNAQSGRYEPVTDRRGSMRQDQHQKPHALLQRPSQSDYPEPSGAFQTNRVTQEAPFGRRRGSSNVSGGSGQYYQRMVKGNEGPMAPHDHRAPEHPGVRRTSFAGSAVESPVSPGNLPVQPHQPAWSRPSPRQAFAVAHQAGPPQAGPSPDAAVAAAPPPVAPTQPVVDELEYQKKLMRERVELARKRRQEEEAREEAERKERIRQKLAAMGPPPEKKSEKKESPKAEVAKPTQIQQREPNKDAAKVPSQPQADGEKDTPPVDGDAAVQDTRPANASRPTPAQPGNRRASQSQELKPAVLWGNASVSRQERLSSWGAPQQAPRAGNVWGAPNNDRGLGNGTFNTDLGRLATDSSAATPGAAGSAPIAPPPAGSRLPSQGRNQPPAPIGSRTSSRYGAPGSDLASKWAGTVVENDRKLTAERLAERTERERQLAERGLSLEDAQPVIKDTWRQVHAPGDATRRTLGTTETQTHQHGWKAPADELVKGSPKDDLPVAANAGVIGSGSSGGMLSQAGKGTPSQGRGSRFFPARDVRMESSPPVDPARSKSPTPPPPTMEGHPAYEGDIRHPHVSLPKPQPIVKLPPAMQASQARPQFGWAHSAPYKDARASVNPHRPSTRAGEASQEEWQNRINSLLNGQRSPPHKSIVVDAASKSVLDHAAHHDSATVSLPLSPLPARAPRRLLGNQRSPTSKPMAEECFEEQEMGSLPQIRLPHNAPEALWQPADAPKPLDKDLRVQPTVIEPYYFPAGVQREVVEARLAEVLDPVGQDMNDEEGGEKSPMPVEITGSRHLHLVGVAVIVAEDQTAGADTQQHHLRYPHEYKDGGKGIGSLRAVPNDLRFENNIIL